MPLAVPALIVMRSPGDEVTRNSVDWPPVMRKGTAGISYARAGAHASVSTSDDRCVATQAGSVCADTATGTASAAMLRSDAAVCLNLMAPSTGEPWGPPKL